MAVYLLHFSEPLQRVRGPGAQHYLGWAPDRSVAQRLAKHMAGTSGVKVVDALHKHGSVPMLAKMWPGGDRALERYLKQLGHLKRHCPVCRSDELKHHREGKWARRQLAKKLSPQPSSGPTTENNGDLSAIKKIDNAGLYLPELQSGSGTSLDGEQVQPQRLHGGTPSVATVQTRRRAGASVGTKQRSTSAGSTTQSAPAPSAS